MIFTVDEFLIHADAEPGASANDVELAVATSLRQVMAGDFEEVVLD